MLFLSLFVWGHHDTDAASCTESNVAVLDCLTIIFVSAMGLPWSFQSHAMHVIAGVDVQDLCC